MSGPLSQWAERGADNAKAVSSILTQTIILVVSPFFCSCISLLQTARVTDLLITGQLVLAGAPLNNFWGLYAVSVRSKQEGKQCPCEFHRLVLLYVSDILRVMF